MVTKTHQDYLALVAEICSGHPMAYRWFCQVMEAALVWDHVVDGDPVSTKDANATFVAMSLEWINNPFFYAHRAALTPVLMNAIGAWMHSKPDTVKGYDLYTELPTTLALVIHGTEAAQKCGGAIRHLIERERWEDTRRDHAPFLIVGLPRSRTAWLAAFLSDGEVFCHHELIRRCDSVECYESELLSTRHPIVGDADPSLPLFYSRVKDRIGPHKVIFINRDPAEARSAHRWAIQDLPDAEKLDANWPTVEKAFRDMKDQVRDSMQFSFKDLEASTTVRALFEYATGRDLNQDREAWERFMNRFKQFDEMKITAIPAKVIANTRIIT